ncbi:MAG: DNA alkylation repair protein, partial [Verrucomicrobia bacterium]|nr:DNA alkylation repair protein [Verrucomicrobiota bacterium]
MTATTLIAELRSLRNPVNIAGQRRFGITPKTEHLGISIAVLRPLARPHRKNHALALELWASGIHEARILAALIEDPDKVTRAQAERWVRDFDSWDICDQVCGEVLPYVPFAIEKALQWTTKRPEFVKRAGFVLMARMAVRRKDLPDESFLDFLPIIRRESHDDRNFVRKAINWALRQIGKRDSRLRRAAIAEAKAIAKIDSRAARWIAKD